MAKPDPALRIYEIDRRYDLFRSIVRGVVAVAVVWAIAFAVVHLAGRSTNVALNWVFKATANAHGILEIGLTSTSMAWAVAERMARRRTVKRFAPLVKQREAADPRRSSSSLAPTGATNPRDL